MPSILQREIEKLKKHILSLGAMVEKNVDMAVKALKTKDKAVSENIIAADKKVDEYEVEIEEECLKVLALHQPVAVDLRFITSIMKINNDLERIGDEAVNIAERVIYIASSEPMQVDIDYKIMTEKTRFMLKSSLDALVNLDVDLAKKIILMDNEVDDFNRDIFKKVVEMIGRNPGHAAYLISFFSISRYLERIADHATNIAEDVIYLAEGVIKRHKKE